MKQKHFIDSHKGATAPAVLDHYVKENKGSEKRISMSFNCYLFPLMIPNL